MSSSPPPLPPRELQKHVYSSIMPSFKKVFLQKTNNIVDLSNNQYSWMLDLLILAGFIPTNEQYEGQTT